jgi:hypothetical protein
VRRHAARAARQQPAPVARFARAPAGLETGAAAQELMTLRAARCPRR